MSEMNLPDWVWDYGTPVEYLESTGKQWIDLPILTEEMSEIELDYQLLTTSLPRGILGYYNTRDTSDSELTILSQGTYALVINNYYQIEKDFFKIKRNIRLSKDKGVYIDNEIVITTPPRLQPNFVFNYFSLFRTYYRYFIIAKIYNFKITSKNNGVILHLIPLLDKSNRPCMFDLISKQYFYNAGETGEFLHGGIISKSNLSPEWLLRKKEAMMMAKKQIN